MVWFKVDDSFPSHRKVLAIPRGPRRLAAIGAWTLAGAWSSANKTEGKLPDSILEELAVPLKVVADLVASGLWRSVENGYVMHDFLDYNPSAEQVDASRAAAAERQRKARERARAAREEAVRHTVSHVVTDAQRSCDVTQASRSPRPDPTRPDPVLPTEVPTESATRSLPRPAGGGDFDAWYAAYPLHKGRGAAEKAYARAVRKTDPHVLLDAACRFAADPTRDPGFTPHPATWLNQGRWDDEGPARVQPVAVNRSQQRHDANLATIHRIAAGEQRQRELGAS